MKYLYKEFHIINFEEKNKKSPKINLEIDIYSDKKLTETERNNQTKSISEKLLILRKQILSSKGGDIVFTGQTFIMPLFNPKRDNNIPDKSLVIEVKRID